MDQASILRFVLLSCIWGSSFTFIKISLQGLTPGQLVLARLILGAAVLLTIAGLRRIRLPSPGSIWGHVAVVAVLGMVAPFFLLAWGERHASAAMAGVLIGATPLLTLAIATAVLAAERATWRKAIGLLLGFAGVLVVIAPWHSDPGSLTGQLACLGAAASYAAGFVYVRKFISPRGLAPLALAAAQLVSAIVLQAVLTPFTAWQAPSFSPSVITSILILGAVSTGLGYVLYFRLIADVGATTASAVNYLVPIAAVLISVLVLSEPITWNMVVGTVVVLAGLAVAENRLAVLGGLRSPRPSQAQGESPRPAEPAGRTIDSSRRG